MTNLIWMIKWVKHIIEVVINITIVFINYVVNLLIISQIIFNISSINKFNFRFVRVFTYFNQFRLNVKYRFKKLHVISNVLSKLSIALLLLFIDFHVDDFKVLNIDAFFMKTIFALSKQRISCENRFKILNLNIYYNGFENSKIFD